jgi:hypothetical protein
LQKFYFSHTTNTNINIITTINTMQYQQQCTAHIFLFYFIVILIVPNIEFRDLIINWEFKMHLFLQVLLRTLSIMRFYSHYSLKKKKERMMKCHQLFKNKRWVKKYQKKTTTGKAFRFSVCFCIVKSHTRAIHATLHIQPTFIYLLLIESMKLLFLFAFIAVCLGQGL